MTGDDFRMGFGGGFMLLFWIFLVIVIIWVVKTAAGNSNSPAEKQKSALDILDERYATGEIDQEEFEQKRKFLMND